MERKFLEYIRLFTQVRAKDSLEIFNFLDAVDKLLTWFTKDLFSKFD